MEEVVTVRECIYRVGILPNGETSTVYEFVDTTKNGLNYSKTRVSKLVNKYYISLDGISCLCFITEAT